MEMAATAHERLHPQLSQFRLLHLEPATDLSAPIEIRTFVCDLDNAPSYDAVSYTWGQQNQECLITVNGYQLSVTKSLYTTLTYLRHPSKERILWIDGVCINQRDVAERNHQVTMMGLIYTRASNVRVWLGKPADDSNRAMALMADLNKGHSRRNREGIVTLLLADRLGCEALTRLLQRSYWQRMWVFQEVVLARSATIHCGMMEVDWEVLRVLDLTTADQSLWSTRHSQGVWVTELRKAFFGIAQFFMNRIQASSPTNVLVPTRRLQATDPRDKLYALVGLCGEKMKLVPDYSHPSREVYMTFTLDTMIAINDVSLLLTAGLWNDGNGPDIGLPSWVPDFRGIHGVDLRYLAASHLKYFNASLKQGSSHSYYICQANIEEGQLGIHGRLFGKIKKSEPLGKGSISRGSIMSTFAQGQNRSSSEEAGYQALFRVLVFDDPTLHEGNSDLLGTKLSERYKRLILGFAQDIVTLRAEQNLRVGTTEAEDFLGSFKSHGRILRDEFARLASTDPGELYWYQQEYLVRAEEMINEVASRIFSTEDGWIGQGPGNIMNGDCLAILYGCHVPVVLRPTGLHYRLVGPCYVDGMMHGEMISCQPELVSGVGDMVIMIM